MGCGDLLLLEGKDTLTNLFEMDADLVIEYGLLVFDFIKKRNEAANKIKR